LASKHRTHCFVITDPLESHCPDVGLMHLQDAETGERILVDTGAFSADDWLAQRERSLRRSGALVSTIDTRVDPFQALMKHFRQVERLR
jgi:uncharacterized protein (DUF58 family)